MDTGKIDIKEFHWIINMLQSIDVGLIILDKDYQIQVWNTFMQNHSGKKTEKVIGKNIFEVFPDLPEKWVKRKAETGFLLKSRSFTIWEQRPYLFEFKNYRPITGSAEFMYQNSTFIPLASVSGVVDHIGIIIYDVTDIAVNKIDLEAANVELETLSRIDGLTKLNNRRYWEDCLKLEYYRYQRTKMQCSLVFFDIDHFKAVNDTYGHQAGDAVLVEVAKLLKHEARATDITGRYGGEEFGVILIDTTAENARLFAERLRCNVEKHTVIHDQEELNVTISLGIAEITEKIEDHKRWLECADQALYQAKETGRNQSIIYQQG